MILSARRTPWPKRVCPKCTRIGRRGGFDCTMPACPPTLIVVHNATEYLRLAHVGKVPEPGQPKKPKRLTKPRRRRASRAKRPPRVQKPRRRTREPGTPPMARREISRLGAIARWAKWRAEKSTKVNANE